MYTGKTTTHDYMTIVLTHECNKKCAFCIDSYRGNCEYISLESVGNALEHAKRNNLKDILLVGGEPTLHPKVLEIASLVKSYGFNLILTTNYTKPDIVKELDKYVDSFNISFYNQKELPKQSDFKADLTLTTLIHAKQLDTKDKLDSFIDNHNDIVLKFSTLSICNEWTAKNQNVPYLDSLDSEYSVLFNEILGQTYRGCIIKRYDRVINKQSHQSFKCHVTGKINQSWDRNDLTIY